MAIGGMHTVLTSAYMGVRAGTAHGKAALHPANIAAAPLEQIEHEMKLSIESQLAIEIQLSALMQEPYTLFALECSDCDMWSLGLGLGLEQPHLNRLNTK